MDTTALEQEIKALESKLTGDMFTDMEIRDQIHNLKMKLKGIKPMNQEIDCVGCGS
ncbi:MAG: hypothetical protein AAF740_10430 [Bacteroidota bacterium]